MGEMCWPSKSELNEIRTKVGKMCGRDSKDVRVVVSPYRICPLGAHIDHQGGIVSAMTINKGIVFGFVPSDDSQVLIQSAQFKGEVRFSVDEEQVPSNAAKLNDSSHVKSYCCSWEECSWGNYARGALYALQKRGNCIKQKNFGEICLVLSPLMKPSFICSMHVALSSKMQVGIVVVNFNPQVSRRWPMTNRNQMHSPLRIRLVQLSLHDSRNRLCTSWAHIAVENDLIMPFFFREVGDKVSKFFNYPKVSKSIGSMVMRTPEQVIEDRHAKGPSQTTIESRLRTPEEKERVHMHIANFFYECGIPFNAANSRSYEVMVESIGQYGPGLKPLTFHELRKPLLKKAKEETDKLKEKHEKAWKKYGCTLMSDGWTDRRGRHLINFLANSPEGTFFLGSVNASSESHDAPMLANLLHNKIKEIGEKNVVQVVTDNGANYKAAGELLEAMIPTLFWTPCAAHCIDLMLEDIGKLTGFKKTINQARRCTTFIYRYGRVLDALREKTNGRDIVRPGATRFATAFLTLQSMYKNREPLRYLFCAEDWTRSKLAKTENGKKVCDTVFSSNFWNNVEECIQASQPLLVVLRIVDADERPALAEIASAMDFAKNKIKTSFEKKQALLNKVVRIINDRWEKQMGKPLYGAALFLNPRRYFDILENDPSYASRLREDFNDVLEKMITDRPTRDKISNYVDDYKNSREGFAREMALEHRRIKSPLDWWDAYGGRALELQLFAKRIVGLCCSSSGCERNWSTFEFGIIGYICGGAEGLDSSGLSSSAAVGVAYLLAFESANKFVISPAENIEYDRLIENEFLGLKNGILDQSAILLSSYGCLTCMNCKTKEHRLIRCPKLNGDHNNGADKPFKILLAFSGLKQALISNPGYNSRVSECREAAKVLLQASGNEGLQPLLSNVEAEAYEEHKFKLDPNLARRAEHYFSENRRVLKGLEAWESGNIEEFGKLISASGLSSIQNYESGCEPLIQLYEILLKAPGVYGARFSGAGFRGCCIAFVSSDRALDAASYVRREYPKFQPELASQIDPERMVLICDAAGCAHVT